jgi:hypothetical protein
LAKAWRVWYEAELPEDIFDCLRLSSFQVEDPDARPLRWDVMFETTGEKWLAMSIPFIDDVPQKAVVDS